MLKNVSIGVKLIASFMSIALVVLVLGIIQYSTINNLIANDERVSNLVSQRATAKDIRIALLTEMKIIHQMWIATDEDSLDEEGMKGYKDLHNKELEKIRAYYNGLINGGEGANGMIFKILDSELNNYTKSLLSTYNDNFVKSFESLQDAINKKLKKTDEGGQNLNPADLKAKIADLNENCDKTCKKLIEDTKEIEAKVKSKIVAKQKESAETTSASKTIAIAGMIIGLILAIALGILITLIITKQLNKVITDLTDVTAGVNTGAQQITAASAQVSDSSQNIAEGANNQAASLEQTSASLEQMSAMVKQNADNSKQAATMSADTSKSAQTGKEVMSRMTGAIEKIKSSSDETAKIIKTIDEIAFQTNLLALNAAVEAARAGEAGKGFAVVAEEVRNLAQRSATAAKNTAELIEQSQKNADNGVKVSTEVSGILNDIVEGIQKVGLLINEVSTATDEQSHGLDEINKAVAELDKVTQGNASNAEATASASEELSAQAVELSDYVNRLEEAVISTKALIGGKNTTSLHNYNSNTKRPAPASKIINIKPDHSTHSKPQTKRRVDKSQHKSEARDLIPLDENELNQF
ncbi:MAG: methyl-accepting chemotaxis protein [Nitrospirae bacterium]|nr:methyl-accepting chemotaxis protein [Nitrospirota bacterium]